MALIEFTPPVALPQDDDRSWHDYNAAQVAEKSTVMSLLSDLCSNVPQPEYQFGRPRLPLADMVFVAALKVYSGFSARRFSTDVSDAYTKGFIDCEPSFISVNRYLSNPALTPIIKGMIGASANPLSPVETQFAIDSSGFSTSRHDRWYSAKWGKEKTHRRWLKAHIAIGVRTNIVTAIEVTPSTVGDAPMLATLVDKTAERFTVSEVSADKAYLSNVNLEHIVGHGAYPFIPFRSDSIGNGTTLWNQLYAHFMVYQTDFMNRYHLRSNVETTFSMVKGKFGDAVRAKSETGQINEVLLKFLLHNLAVLCQAMRDLDITPALESEVQPESKVVWLNHYR